MRIVDDKILTPREKEITLLIVEGKNKREIADILFLTISTIKANVENIYIKFGVHNKVELVIYLIKNKILVFDEE